MTPNLALQRTPHRRSVFCYDPKSSRAVRVRWASSLGVFSKRGGRTCGLRRFWQWRRSPASLRPRRRLLTRGSRVTTGSVTLRHGPIPWRGSRSPSTKSEASHIPTDIDFGSRMWSERRRRSRIGRDPGIASVSRTSIVRRPRSRIGESSSSLFPACSNPSRSSGGWLGRRLRDLPPNLALQWTPAAATVSLLLIAHRAAGSAELWR